MAFDEIQNLIINVQGRDDILQLREAIAQEEAALVRSVAAYGAHSAAAKANAQTIQVLQADLKKTEAQVHSTTTNIKGYGQAALTASYAFQDFTSVQGSFSQKLASVQNNLPSLIMQIGGPGMAGLAGAISIVSVGIGMAVPELQKLAKNYGLIGDEASKATSLIAKLEARIKELEKQPVKLGVDLLELDQAKIKLEQLRRDQAAFSALRDGKTTFEKEAGAQFRDNFDEMGKAGIDAKNAIASQIAVEANESSPTLNAIPKVKEDIKAAEDAVANAFDAASRRQAQTQLDQLNARLAQLRKDAPGVFKANREAAEAKTGGLFSGAFAGNDKGAREELLRRLRAAGQDQLANALEVSTPEEMERLNDIDNAFQHSEDAWAGGGKINRQRRLDVERRVRIQKQEEADRLHNEAIGVNAAPLPGDQVRVFPGGGVPGRAGGGAGGAGGEAEASGLPASIPALGQRPKPQTIEARTALRARLTREAREARAFRARVRASNKRVRQSGNGVLAAAAPPRRPAPAADAAPQKDAAQTIQQAQAAQIEFLQMQNLMYAAAMERFQGFFGQASKALQELQARQNAQARRAMQDNDSYLGMGQ